MCDNLDDEQKQQLKIKGQQKEKNKSVITLNVDEKKQLRIYKKKGKKVMGDNLDDEQKEH